MTNYSVVNSLQILRVHVASVGFEIDRIVLPAIKMKADRVYLITHNEPHADKDDKLVKSIQSKLKDARILYHFGIGVIDIVVTCP